MIAMNSINPVADIERIDSLLSLIGLLADPKKTEAALKDMRKAVADIGEQRTALQKDISDLQQWKADAKAAADAREAELVKREKAAANAMLQSTNLDRRAGGLDKLAASLTAKTEALKAEATRVDVAASALRQREEAVAKKESILAAREEQLSARTADIDKRYSQLKALVG